MSNQTLILRMKSGKLRARLRWHEAPPTITLPDKGLLTIKFQRQGSVRPNYWLYRESN